jgi:hypothetical protein
VRALFEQGFGERLACPSQPAACLALAARPIRLVRGCSAALRCQVCRRARPGDADDFSVFSDAGSARTLSAPLCVAVAHLDDDVCVHRLRRNRGGYGSYRLVDLAAPPVRLAGGEVTTLEAVGAADCAGHRLRVDAADVAEIERGGVSVWLDAAQLPAAGRHA